jgi:hypothetical protein
LLACRCESSLIAATPSNELRPEVSIFPLNAPG